MVWLCGFERQFKVGHRITYFFWIVLNATILVQNKIVTTHFATSVTLIYGQLHMCGRRHFFTTQKKYDKNKPGNIESITSYGVMIIINYICWSNTFQIQLNASYHEVTMVTIIVMNADSTSDLCWMNSFRQIALPHSLLSNVHSPVLRILRRLHNTHRLSR